MGSGLSRWNFSRRCAITVGSWSSPPMAIAGSPGRSCCSPKISTDTRKSVGRIAERRFARKATIAVLVRSALLQALQAHEAVGHGAQARELVRVDPQPIAVVQVDDRPVLHDVRGELLEELPPLPGVELTA